MSSSSPSTTAATIPTSHRPKSRGSETSHLGDSALAKSSYGKESVFSKGFQSASLEAMRERARQSELRVTRKIFHTFDADGSGTIDTVELRAVMHAMGHDLSDQQLSELVEQVDADGSGDICFDEFVQLIGIWKEANQFKIFQTESRSLQEERIEAASKIQMLLPDETLVVVWQLIVLTAIVYSFLITGYLIATTNNIQNYNTVQNATLATDVLASMVFGADIIVTFLTAVRVSYNGPARTLVIDSPREVARRYIFSPWLWIDIVAIPPALRLLNSSTAGFAAISIILKALKIPKLFRRSGKQKMTPLYVYLHFYIIPSVRAAVYFVLGTHAMAVLWTYISIATTPDPIALINGTTGNASAALLPQDSPNSVKQLQVDLSYTNSIYFVLNTITTCGYGDVVVLGSNIRIVVACVFCLFGTIVTGIVIGSIVNILSKTDIDQERESKLRETLAVLEHFEVPGPLASEVLNFQNHLLADSFSDAYADLVMGLPPEMKMNISLFTRVDLVSNLAYFRDAHQGAKVAVANLLAPIVFRPEENIVVAGEKGDCMYFIGYGFVDVMTKTGRSIVVLKRGGFFGEGALLAAGQTRNATVKAITYCDLFTLTRPNFERVLQRFPRFKKEMINTSKERALKMAAETGHPPNENVNSFHVRMAEREARENLIAEKSAQFHDTMFNMHTLLGTMESYVSELSRRNNSNKSMVNRQSRQGLASSPWDSSVVSMSGNLGSAPV